MLLSAIWACVSGCGDETREISLLRLAPTASQTCGAPADARTLRIAAVGDFSTSDATARSIEIALGEPLSIGSFPAETESLEVEVLGAGGALRTIGRSETFVADELKDGETISIFMAPRDGACPTGPPARARTNPLAARTGDDVIVAGGTDAAGAPIRQPEIYLTSEARFEEINQTLFGTPEDGLAGASLTAMPDGRLVLAGGALNAFQVYDPETRLFSEPANLLSQARAFHGAVALDEQRVFFAGGCARVLNGLCETGTESQTTAILNVDSGDLDPGPPLNFVRVGPQAFLEADGTVIVVGGANAGGPVLSAERIDLRPGEMAVDLSGVGQAGVRLASGALLTSFGPANTPSGEGNTFAPGALAGVPLITAGPRAAPTLTALEDGTVLAFGGAESGTSEAALLAPVSGRWRSLDSVEVLGRRRHASALLPDGSVLIIGGESSDGTHLGDALIFRPGLPGPLTGVVTINFSDESAEQLVLRDRGTAQITTPSDAPAYLEISSAPTDEGIPGEWAVIAAPLLGKSELEFTALSTGGLAIITAYRGPTTFRVTTISPGQPISVLDVSGRSVIALAACQSPPVSAETLGAPGRWRHVVTETSISLTREDQTLLDCSVTADGVGRVGLGPLGDADKALRLFQLSVRR